jgi:hypothetical protein
MDDWHCMSKLDDALPYMQERGYTYAAALVPFNASAPYEGNADAFAKGNTLDCSVARFFNNPERVRRHYQILVYFKNMWCYERLTVPIPLVMADVAADTFACAAWFWNTIDCEMTSMDAKAQVFAVCCKKQKKNTRPPHVVNVIDYEMPTTKVAAVARKLCVVATSLVELFPLLWNYIFIHLAQRYRVAIKNRHGAKVAENKSILQVPYTVRGGKWKDASHFYEYCYNVSNGSVDAASLMELMPFIQICLRAGIYKRFARTGDAEDAHKFVFYYS